MKVLLNDNQICSLEYYLDPESQDVYMRIPELSDKYFKTNLKEAADQQASNIESDIEELTPDDTDVDIPTDNFASAYSDSISLSASLMSDLSSALPEASVIETLLDKYGSMLFDNLTEGESSQETLTAGDISQKDRFHLRTLSKPQLNSWKQPNQTATSKAFSIPGTINSPVTKIYTKVSLLLWIKVLTP